MRFLLCLLLDFCPTLSHRSSIHLCILFISRLILHVGSLRQSPLQLQSHLIGGPEGWCLLLFEAVVNIDVVPLFLAIVSAPKHNVEYIPLSFICRSAISGFRHILETIPVNNWVPLVSIVAKYTYCRMSSYES